MKKRAQTDLLGVAVIVIILIIAGIFMIGLRLAKNNNSRRSFEDPELAQSFLSTLMKTKTEKNVIVSEIIKDCYSNRNDICGSTTTSDCCDYAYHTMRNALEATLGNWSKNYRLTVSAGNDKRIDDIPTNSPCGDFSEEAHIGNYYIPNTPQIVLTLMICS